MRVALVSRFAWPSIGGVQMHVRTLASALAEGGTDTTIYAHRIDDRTTAWLGSIDRGESFRPQVDPETGIVTRQLRMGTLPAAVLRASMRMQGVEAFERRHTPLATRTFAAQLAGSTVVHRFGGNRMALPVVRAARRLGAAAVVTPFAHPGQWDDDELSARAYREADLVVASSRADARVYHELGVPAERVRICPPATAEPPPADGRRVRAAHGIDGPIVLFLGVRRETKGIAELLGAAQILAERGCPARFVLVGPGEQVPAGAPNVIDVGATSEDERNAWLHAADVLCMPSTQESFGLVVSEAWTVRVPVVTSDIPVLRERVNEAGGGIAAAAKPAPLADAIGRLLADPGLRRTMGAAGYAHWRRTASPARVAAWHQAVYAELCARPMSRDPSTAT